MMTLLGEIQILLERTYGPTGVNFEDFLLSQGRCRALSEMEEQRAMAPPLIS